MRLLPVVPPAARAGGFHGPTPAELRGRAEGSQPDVAHVALVDVPVAGRAKQLEELVASLGPEHGAAEWGSPEATAVPR